MSIDSKSITAKNFHIVQYVRHPISGETLITLDQIDDGLNHKSIKRYAFIMHDKDTYTEEEARKEKRKADEESRPVNPAVVAGALKPPHYHIVITTVDPVTKAGNSLDVKTIAKWFGVQPQYVDVMRGHGAFLDGVEYLTHSSEKAQKAGKYRYPDHEVEASFDWRAELDKRKKDKADYGAEYASMSKSEQMYYQIYHGIKSLEQCKAEDPLLFMRNRERMEQANQFNIRDRKPPNTRITIYIEGDGGSGKGAASKALAHSLFPDIENEKELFFEVGAKGASFQKYAGQPVIIWNDFRASDLLEVLDNRGNVFNVFDPHPTTQEQNIKYGSIMLCNQVHIINSVQHYWEFLNTLAGREDVGQSYRRFPLILQIHESKVYFKINRGVSEGTSQYRDYRTLELNGNIKRISEICGDDRNLANRLIGCALADVVTEHNKLLEFLNKKHYTQDEIIQIVKEMGVNVPDETK